MDEVSPSLIELIKRIRGIRVSDIECIKGSHHYQIKVSKRYVSLTIPSARPTVSPVAITVFVLKKF